MAAYINGIGIISPQKAWNDKGFLTEPVDYTGDKLTCIEPDYSQFLDIRQLRRMSRIMKMGVAAGMMALQEAEVTVPDGIITGTSLGCLEDTGIFLNKMIENKEYALNPTPFIQSTHNTIGSQIALLLQCQGYNQTYTQRAFSVENALLDAWLSLAENPDQSLLVGGADEITSNSHTLLRRFGVFRPQSTSSLALFNTREKGTLNGEGVTYLVMSGRKGKHAISLESVATFYKPKKEKLKQEIVAFLAAQSLLETDVDLLLVGKSGDRQRDEYTAKLVGEIFSDTTIGRFKHLCGEFPTATGFAVALATRIIRDRQIPDVIVERKAQRVPNNVLIYNPYFGEHHSLILLRSC